MIPLVYRVLLRFYPREFRERFGAELIATASAVDRGPSRKPWRALRDAIGSAIALRRELRREQGRGSDRGRRDAGMNRLLNDVRVAVRGLRREPRFAAFVVTTLAVAIGANATLLGLADRLIFRGPEGIDDAARVMRVQIQAHPPNRPAVSTFSMGHVLFAAIRDRNSTGLQAASYAINDATLGRGGTARPVRLGYASPEFFTLLGTAPARGRFLESRDHSGADAPVVISHPLWLREFGGDDGALGRSLVIDDITRTIVGIAPRGFTGVELGPVDAWLPIGLLNTRTTPQWETSWNAQWLQTVVRLPAATIRDQVDADLSGVLRSSYTGQSQVMRSAELRVVPLTVSRDGNESTDARILAWLFAVSGLVLLVACANVMSLLLARGAARRRDIGVRLALGASRPLIVRQLLVESGVLAALGTAGGLGLAALLGEAARLTLFETVEWTTSPVNVRVVGASALIAVIVTILTGLVPALSASRAAVIPALRGTARDGGLRRSRLRGGLAIAQAAISVILLVGAGLFVRSLWNASTLDLGVDADRVIVAEVTRPGQSSTASASERDAERARRKAMLRDALPAIRSLPGVTQASVAVGMPFGFAFALDVSLPGAGLVAPAGVSVSAVTGGYFETVGTKIVEGRAFGDGDRQGTAPVLIVSAHLARQLWPGRSPLGACLIVGKPPSPCATVVGVAADTHRQRLRESAAPHVYLPAGQETGFGGDVLLVRAERGLDAIAEAVRRTLADRDTSISLVTTETLQKRIDPQLRSWKLGASVFMFAGGLALLVASAGIYSVLSYLVASRRHEIGVRLALGATASHVSGMVVRSSLVMALCGIAIGIALAAAISPRLEPMLFDVRPRDPFVFVTVAGVLAAVAVATSLTPAIRASRVSPLEVLRTDC